VEKNGCKIRSRTASTIPLPVSINLSGREFCFDQPAVTMQQALARNSIDPRLLEIEITETVLMEDVENAAETLNEGNGDTAGG
jgi:EAL domain-containing protein (putative c-di-GMP-specific phosphodiesterase class I)